MKLIEIALVKASEMGEKPIRDGIKRALESSNRKLFTKLGSVSVMITDGDTSKSNYYIFVESNRAVGYAFLERKKFDKLDGFFVSEIGLLDEAKGKNIGKDFYEALLDKNMILFSGAHQTPNGSRVWKHLLKSPKHETGVIDYHSHKIIPDVDPWSDPDYVIYAKLK